MGKGVAARAVAWVLAALFLALASPASLQAETPPNAGLGLLGAVAEYTVTPGQIVKHKITVDLGTAGAPVDIQVEARGLGQGPDGAIIPLPATEDASPLSALKAIRSIDKTSFHLDPGGKQEIEVTIAAPQDIGDRSRFADVYIHSAPQAGGRMSSVLAFNVPVILNPAGVNPSPAGKIADVKVGAVTPGKPLEVTTTFQNGGQRHYKAQSVVILRDLKGAELARELVPAAGNSLVPGYPRDFKVAFNLLDKLQGLPAGDYVVETQVLTADGKSLDTKRAQFHLDAPYQLFPGIDAADLVVTNFTNEEPKPIDARRKADTVLTLRDTGKITGTVVIGKYKQEPPGTPRFSDSADKRGFAKPAVKFVGIGVQGFSHGTAEVAIAYGEDDLKGHNPNGLFLAYRVGSGWAKMDNLAVQTGAQLVKGEIAVSVLNGNPVIGLGADVALPAATVAPTVVAKAAAIAANEPNWLPKEWPIGAAAIVGGLGIVIVLQRATAGDRRPRR